MDRHPERCGRWSAMATLSPIRPIWALWLRFYFAIAPFLRLASRRPAPIERLVELSMIGFARWSLVRSLPWPYLLFETNFDNDSDHYLETFALVIPGGLQVNWLGAYGFPNPRRVARFQNYVNDRKLRIHHYYSAYPTASTKMIRTALELQRQLFAFDPPASPDAFRSAYQRLLERAEAIRDPNARAIPTRHTGSLSFMIPIEQGRQGDVAAAIGALKEAQEPPLPPETHFARWTLIDNLEVAPGQPCNPNRYLLFSVWFDGSPERYLPALHEALGELVAGIYGPCGFSGTYGAAFARFLLQHEVKPGFKFHAYDGATVAEVKEALELSARFGEFVSGAQGLAPAALRDAWEEAQF
jgi:hypothetical protein